MTNSTTPPPDVVDLDKFHTHDDPRHTRLTTPSKATLPPATPPSPAQSTLDFIDIIDIRRDALGSSLDLGRDIMAQLAPARGPKKMPTLLLYDEKGLQTFEEITYLEEYYLTNAEIEVLERNAEEMARNIQAESMVIELGSGNLRKVSILLNALEKAEKSIHYYALDLSKRELERTLSSVPRFEHVVCHGLLGTYDDGLEWIRSGCNASWPKCIMSLGSSIGNFNRGDAAEFLKGFADMLRPSDSMIIGLDACNDPAKVYHAYNDSLGITHKFILNGLDNANSILGENVFDTNDWEVIGEYVCDKDGGRHRAFYAPKRDITIRGVFIEQGERVQVEQSLKYSQAESEGMWAAAGLKEVGKWGATKEQYNIHMLTKRAKPFQLHPSQYALTPTPTLEDWRGLWSTWNTVARGMIPNNELLAKPIKLRNACIFYLGHIPTFLDLQLSKATGVPLCEPSHYPQIFERGIDPDVDNPDNCHAHSEIPDQWPPVEEILEYQAQVRRKVEGLYASGVPEASRKVGRSLWIGLEHEIMHLETLLYMLLQSDNCMPPPRTVKPDFEEQARRDAEREVENQWFTIPEQDIALGLDDPEDNSGDGHFGWDNEKPVRKAHVRSFQAKGRPITNEEYAIYLDATDNENLPASWTRQHANGDLSAHTPNGNTNGYTNGNGHTNGNGLTNGNGHTDGSGHTNGNGYLSNGYTNGLTKLHPSYISNILVRTVYGPVSLAHALHWPVSACYDELRRCAKWMGGRIPTVEEARSIYSYVDERRLKEVRNARRVPAVNAHLVNNGVEESPPLRDPAGSPANPHSALFTDLEGANVGFKHWHPVAVTADGDKLAGAGGDGGGVGVDELGAGEA
ncbi:hypothetical protein GMDG_03866 [Pseudogymnoascus destructans 20631-21]|uniref:Histidine-specific methyltransferase SAM-dependent domain-containing protein n=1 Tax=Pseudogymnoascus destructans (strain ATCC MYA-4855 / 20631-21) TaxID=658429 RepID=L8G9H2_PSED2|nr:hypothetical protein GMDG_03866 [Pseudogymnoascus destructans 20631-21]